MPELTDDELISKWQGVSQPDQPPAAPVPIQDIIPMTAGALSNTSRNLPPVIGDTRRRQEALGEQQGVPFHEEGLPMWNDLVTRLQGTKDEQLKYLARHFGKENVRLNQYQEPVVRIQNQATGKAEDYPLNPHQLTLNSLNVIAETAPQVAGAIAATALGGPTRGTFLRSLFASLGAETVGAMEEAVASGGQRIQKPIEEHLANVPIDMMADLGIAGLIKGGQAVKGLGLPKFLGGSGLNIPNPVGGTFLTQPSRPEFTQAGVKAAQELQSASGINPNLRGSETTGLPIAAMLEQYFSRTASGATPQIQAQTRREEASKAIQNWMVDPSTLGTDEAVGKGAISALKSTVEPYEKDVALAKFAQEAEQKGMQRLAESRLQNATQTAQKNLTTSETAKILGEMNVSTISDRGVDLAPVGQALGGRAVEMRDAVKAQNDALYDAFRAHPMAKEPVVTGDYLKSSLDKLLTDLPKVRKTVEQEVQGLGGQSLVGPSGQPLTETVTKDIPVSTPIRPRLEELSKKLTDGTVSINDLKEIRTDVGNAMQFGEPFAGYKEGRLKSMYKSLSEAIDDGLKQIDDPELTKLWKAADSHYEASVKPFEQKAVAPLFREADQASSVGPSSFTRKAITDPDVYTALKTFYGETSPEVQMLRETIKNKTLSDALSPGGLVDGKSLTQLLKTMKDQRPAIFEDVFGGKGNDLLKAADQLGSWQQKVPIEEVNKLLGPGASAGPPSVKLISLQAAQRRLNEEYQNGIVAKFVKGDIPAENLRPDTFVASLPQAKLSDVQEVMKRLESQDPDVMLQVRRKAIQNLLADAKTTTSPQNTMAKLEGEPGDLITGSGIEKVLFKNSDQNKKYQAILGPDAYNNLINYAKMELLGEQRLKDAAGVGMLVPGSIVGMLKKALTPWEGKDKGKGMMMELGSLARDKMFSIAIADPRIQNWLQSPYALKDASGAIKAMIVSEPFLKGMFDEFKDRGTLQKALSALKVGMGTAQGVNEGKMSTNQPTDEQLIQKYSPQP